jgi:hypothetical protein
MGCLRIQMHIQNSGRPALYAKLMKEILAVVVKEVYNVLPAEQCRTLDLFIWGGAVCTKI